jgi:hypothetical protein
LLKTAPPSRIKVAVRTLMSPWRVADVPLRDRWPARLRPRRWLAFAAIMVNRFGRRRCLAAAGTIVAGIVLVLVIRPTPAPAHRAIPTSLEQRVPLLVSGWLEDNMPLMLRLTEAARDRELRLWLSQNSRPRLAAGNRPTIEVVRIHRSPTDEGAATVVARLSLGTSTGSIQLPQQRWIQRRDGWYFVPSIRQTRH